VIKLKLKLFSCLMILFLILGFMSCFTIISTVKADDINHATIPDDWNSVVSQPELYPWVDVVTEDGYTALRLDVDDTEMMTRECVSHWISVSPGDHLVFRALVKTGSHANTVYTGGRIGIDFYVNLVAPPQYVTICTTLPYDYEYVDGGWRSGSLPSSHYTGVAPETGLGNPVVTEFKLPWNNNWTLLEYDIVVPTTSFTKDVKGNTLPTASQIIGCYPWVDAREIGDDAYAYFAEPEFYVNPSSAGSVFGEDDVLVGGTDTQPSGYVSAVKYTAPQTGYIDTIHYYARTAASNGNVTVFVYSDNASSPYAKLATSSPMTVGTSASWVNFTIPETYVTNGTNYWFAFMCNTTLYSAIDTGSTNQWKYTGGGLLTYPNAPAIFESDGAEATKASIYATYGLDPEPPSTPPPVPPPVPVNLPTVVINSPRELWTYTSANITLTITAVNSNVTWYNVQNGTEWVYASNVTYLNSTTLSGFETGVYTCYAWAISNDSYVAVDTVEFMVDVDATLPSVNMDAFWIFFYEGNFLGGVQSYFISSFLNLETAIALIAMLFLVPLYLRTKSLVLICILWIMLGGFFIAAMPMASGLAVLFMALGVGGLVWRLFKSSAYG